MTHATSEYLNRPVRSLEQARADIAASPFMPGQRVLEHAQPWWGSWTVTGCERHPKGGWTLRMKSGAAEAIDMASRYMPAPADWEEPPAQPTFRAVYGLKDMGWAASARADDSEYQAALLAYYRAYAAWAERHLPALGDFADHIAAARRMAGADLELVRAAE